MSRGGDAQRAAVVLIILCSAFQASLSELLLVPLGPTLLNALVGWNVTLPVSFSGAPDPVVTWFMGSLPVATWTVNSSVPPDIAASRADVLRVETNGSLTLVNVPLGYDANYTIELTKSGLDKALGTFSLRVFEPLQGVSLTSEPDVAVEGLEEFRLQHHLLGGVVQHRTWFFNGREIHDGPRYSVEREELLIVQLQRGDTGEYAVRLTNPFSSATARRNVTVRYGPDEPVLAAHPAQSFYTAGDSVNLSCRADGFPPPTAAWTFNQKTLPSSPRGVLELSRLSTGQGGIYTCTLVNEETRQQRQSSVHLRVYERPSGRPVCSVVALNDTQLLYRCGWTGGTPPALLSFPALNANSREETLSFPAEASAGLNGLTVRCAAQHVLQEDGCNVTALGPVRFVPSVRTSVDDEGKIVVSIQCVSRALPAAVVSWSRGSEAVISGSAYQISANTTLLEIRHLNVSNFLLHNYSCTCRNPLGRRRRDVQLQGPLISRSSLFPNHDGSIATLTWEVPPTSVVTGFDIQMKGPALLSANLNAPKGSSDGFRTIQQKPGSHRSADVYVLDPKSTYRFRIVPKARLAAGEPSEVHRIGPGDGLSGAAVAGLAAGIPCSLLALLLLCVLVYLAVYCYQKKDRPTSYPVTRAAEKQPRPAQAEKPAHALLAGGLRSAADYNRLHQTPSERSVALPSFVPPPPVRVATTV